MSSASVPIPVALIDYGMGNLRSVARALEKCGAKVHLATRPRDVPKEARALVFPGQGAIADCMKNLNQTNFDMFLHEWLGDNKPFFGICLGLQALFEHSEEGDCDGLGIFPGEVRRFVAQSGLKVPHMGWNTARFRPGVPLMQGIGEAGEDFYFVHSYHLSQVPDEIVWCETEYGIPFVSGICYKRCFATQFHPEKSQSKGLQLYQNFLDMAGS